MKEHVKTVALQENTPCQPIKTKSLIRTLERRTSGYNTWFTPGGAIRIAHYDVTDDVITQKL